jgi:uncharacterized protein (TIGR03435 family)
MASTRAGLLTVLFLVGVSTAAAQPAAVDVASIKSDASDRPSAIRLLPGGQITATRVTLHDLILRAYQLHESQVVGGPDWLKSARFEVVAKSSTPPSGGMPAVLSMLQALLVDRFGLRIRRELREVPVYVLIPVRDDGRAGANVRASRVDCAANPASPVPNSMTLTSDGWPPCGLTFTRTLVGTARVNAHVRQSAVPMSEVAYRLQPAAGRAIVNRSGMTGLYDVEYTYSSGSIAGGGAADAEVPDAPDLFTAIREQLGLKLESRREAIDVLVIESAALIEN